MLIVWLANSKVTQVTEWEYMKSQKNKPKFHFLLLSIHLQEQNNEMNTP